MKLKENYILANCCHPQAEDAIVGYYSHDNFIKVHKATCGNLAKAETARLVNLVWHDIIIDKEFVPDNDFAFLDEIDFMVLRHHRDFGIDYSLMLAAALRIDRQTAFDRHAKLLKMGLLQRVPAVMVQYRKNIVKGKWIKHRNHTYYDLTDRGRNYLHYYMKKP
jgi:hypothetical protein